MDQFAVCILLTISVAIIMVGVKLYELRQDGLYGHFIQSTDPIEMG